MNIEKEPIDEIRFRTSNERKRLILEMMARGGMRMVWLEAGKAQLIQRRETIDDLMQRDFELNVD